MINIILAYVRGFMTKFKTLYWNGYEIRLLHYKNNIRSMINLIPYFWDDEVFYTLVIRPSKKVRHINDIWKYQWRLIDLEGNLIKHGTDEVDVINTKWMRRYFKYWTSGKTRAIVLGNLSPNRNYILNVRFINGNGESSEETVMATLSTKDRADFYMQIFLIIFSIVAALFFATWSRGCGL